MAEDVDRLLREANVHVAPTIAEEPYGLVVVEAMRPSIIFRSGGIEGIVLKEQNISSLQRALELYLANPQLAAAHGLAAERSLH